MKMYHCTYFLVENNTTFICTNMKYIQQKQTNASEEPHVIEF